MEKLTFRQIYYLKFTLKVNLEEMELGSVNTLVSIQSNSIDREGG
jgi:hypothetical protein